MITNVIVGICAVFMGVVGLYAIIFLDRPDKKK